MISDNAKVFILMFFAFLIRVIGINFGPYYPDEHLIINHALAFGTGDLNPHMFYFPSFFMYLLFFVYGLFYIAGCLVGFFHSPENILTLYLESPHVFYVLGRFVSVLFGTASVLALYGLGKEYKNKRTGLLVALFLTVNFLHSRDSHFAVMDITLTFFCILSFYFLFRYWNHGQRRWFAAAVFTAGVASAIKYNAFILVLPIAMVYFFTRLQRRDWEPGMRAVLSFLWASIRWGGLMILAFFIFSPYVLLDFKSALDFITRLYQINLGFKVHWMNHVRMLFYSLDVPLFILALAGFLRSLTCFGKKDFVLVSFFTVYYVMITKAGQPFERYVLLLVPICILWAASFLEGSIERLRQRRPRLKYLPRFIVIVVTLTLLPKTAYSDFLFLKKDTRSLAASWIKSHIPEGATVILDDPGQCPKLTASKQQIADKIRALKREDPLFGAKEKRLKSLYSLEFYPTPSYNLYFLQEDRSKSQYEMLGPFLPYDSEGLREVVGTRYLVTSDKSMLLHADFYATFKDSLELLVVFDPRRVPEHPMNPVDWTYLPIDGFFWNVGRPGPLVYVYKIKR